MKIMIQGTISTFFALVLLELTAQRFCIKYKSTNAVCYNVTMTNTSITEPLTFTD